MAQKLIVEGKDAIALANILRMRGMKPPKGYRKPEKFKKEFVKIAGSKSQIQTAIREALETPLINRIGIIVDADFDKAQNVAQSYVNQIVKILEINQMPIELSKDGLIISPIENLTIGIWVMPNNSNEGYLEHFLARLIPSKNRTWQFAKEKVDELIQSDFCEFSEVKTQKAYVHTYLAWKDTAGLPFGTAVTAKYFDAKSKEGDAFASWCENTFELE